MSVPFTARRGRLVVGLAMGCLLLFSATVRAGQQAQFDDPVKQGEYLANIAGCTGCHTPVKPDYTLDTEKFLAGGRPFDLGPLGVLLSRNLTPDKETGLGEWTDEEIKTAVRTGRTRDGQQLFPLMPYHTYNNMAEADLDAIVAYLRTVPAVKNQLPREELLPSGSLQAPPIKQDVVAPSPADTAARGRYLLTSVIPCSDCHTPIDAASGQPVLAEYLAGGQPYEGPWGIIYGGNITPDKETGIGNWTDAEIKQVLTKGIRPDGRHTVLMPWEEYAWLTEEDVNAVIHYLRNEVQPVRREVPAPALKPEFIRFAEQKVSEPAATGSPTLLLALLGVGAVGAVLLLVARRRRAAGSS